MADSTFGGNGNGKPFRQYQNDPFDSTFRKDPARDIQGMPPNLGRWAIPQVWTFQGLVSSIAKTYRNPDEAVKHSLDNARFMRQDIGIMECLESRMRSTALLDWHIEIDGPDLPYHKALQERMTSILKQTPRFTQYRYQLLEALWYGRYGVQNRYEWKITPEGRDLIIKQWFPINGDKLVFRQDDGSDDHPLNQVGVRVGAQFKPNDIIEGRVVVPTESGLATFLAPYERNMVAIHRHLIEDASYETPFDSGSVHGIGIRSRIYWEWFQKQELLALFMEYLERAALGFEIWYYPDGNDKAYRDMKAAAENRNGRKTILMFPKPIGDDQMAFGVEHIEPNPAGAESFKDVLQGYFGHRIKRYILGQILTSEAEATGLGSGVADLHLQTMLDIIKFDATNLEETITREVVEPLKIWNDRNAHNVDVQFKIQTQTPDVDKLLQAYEAAWNMGARLKESDVMDAIGASIPEYDEPALQNPTLQAQALQNQQMQQQMQMQAMGMVPAGMAPPPGEGQPPEEQGDEQYGDPTEPGAQIEVGEPDATGEQPAPEPGAIVPGAGLSNVEIGAGVGHAKNIKAQLVQGLRAFGYKYSKQGEVERYAPPLLASHERDPETNIPNEMGRERIAMQQEHEPSPEEHAGEFNPQHLKRMPNLTKGIKAMRTGKELPKIQGPHGQQVVDIEGLRHHMAKFQKQRIELDHEHPAFNKKAYNKMIDRMSHEAHWQATEGNVPGVPRWYSHGIHEATKITDDHLPEVTHPDYPAHRHMFTAFLAATSPQKPVPRNYHEAVVGTSHMFDNHNGVDAPQFPTKHPVTGKKFGVSEKSIHLLNHLVKEHWDVNSHLAHDPLERRERAFEGAVNWLHGEHHPWELWDLRKRAKYKDENGEEKHVFGPKLTTDEDRDNADWAAFKPAGASTLRKTAYGPSKPIAGHRIFGQKVGQFFANLTGDSKGSTIDLHAVRNIARHSGQMHDEARFPGGTRGGDGDDADEEKVRLPGVPKPGENPIMQKVYENVANRYNKKYRQGKAPYDVRAIQALKWVFEKGLYAKHGYEKAEHPSFLQDGAYSFDREANPRRPAANQVAWNPGAGGERNGAGPAKTISYTPPVKRHTRHDD